MERRHESWINTHWRPAIGWLYVVLCSFDFIIFPAISMVISNVPWKSLTLENGGIIHISFGAILGVTAWGRNQIKKPSNT